MLLAEPHGWFLSRDGGATFATLPHRGGDRPAEYHLLFGGFQVCCDGDERPRVVGRPLVPSKGKDVVQDIVDEMDSLSNHVVVSHF